MFLLEGKYEIKDNKMIFKSLLILALSQGLMAATLANGKNPMSSVPKTISDCSMPSEDDLVRILAASGEIFAYIINDENDQPPDKPTTNATSDDDTTATMAQQHCPVGEVLDKSAPLRLRSVCPWELIDDYDSNRYPRTIQKAVCLCNHCIDPSSNQLNENLSCAPVYYPMPVLRRAGCQDGVATFEPRYEQVPVACDCKAHSKSQNTPNGIPVMDM